jgi:signal peptide peptidase SppA
MYPLLFSKYINVPLLASTNFIKTASTFLLSQSHSIKSLSSDSDPKNNINAITQKRADIGILNVTGEIFRYGKVEACSTIYGVEHYAKAFKRLEEDKSINKIIMNFDTWGGEANGIDEFAKQIKASNKEVVAYVDGNCASAGYWLASACNRIVANQTAFIGSVGVAFIVLDNTKMMDNIGIEQIEIISTASPKKRTDIKTQEGQEQIQVLANDLADIFVSTVAKNRKVSIDKVLNDFGQGDVMIASKAKSAKMIDEINDFENLILKMGVKKMNTEDENNTNNNDITDKVLTPSAFQAQNPLLYSQILTIGANDERARIKAIYDLNVNANYKEIATTAMFDGKSDARDVKIALFDAQQSFLGEKRDNFYKEGVALGVQLQGIQTGKEFGAGASKVDTAVAKALDKKNKTGGKR